MHNIHGRVTPEVADKLHAALSAGSRPDCEGEVRLPNQRKADALEVVLDTALDSAKLPAEGGQRPHLTVTVDLDRIGEQAQLEEEAQRRRGGVWEVDADEQRPPVQAAAAAADAAMDVTSRRPRFYWTGPASVAATRRLACDGHLLPIFTRDGQPIDVGRHTRVISPAMRALILQPRPALPLARLRTTPAAGRRYITAGTGADGGPTDRWNLDLALRPPPRRRTQRPMDRRPPRPGHDQRATPRAPDDPLYEIRLKAPPDQTVLDVNAKLRAVAQTARAAGGE